MFCCELDWFFMLDRLMDPFAGPAVKEKAKQDDPNAVIKFWNCYMTSSLLSVVLYVVIGVMKLKHLMQNSGRKRTCSVWTKQYSFVRGNNSSKGKKYLRWKCKRQ